MKYIFGSIVLILIFLGLTGYFDFDSLVRDAEQQISSQAGENVSELAESETSMTKSIAWQSAFAKVDYIGFDAALLDLNNFEILNKREGAKLDKSILSDEKTSILLTLDNHRDDLSALDFAKIVTVDGQLSESWTEISTAMGGHHVVGVLTFAKIDNLKNLEFSDTPVGKVDLEFKLITK